MQVDEHSDFDCDPDTLLRLFTTREYFVRKYGNLGAAESEVVECRDDGDRFSISVHQFEAPQQPLPGVIRKIIGNRIGVTRTDTWQRSTGEGRMDVVFDSVPVTVGVDMAVRACGPGCRLHLQFDIRADLPVAGRPAEKALAADIVARVKADLEESRQLLPEFA